jgi:diguanylate cyclase (GGDEF)-like protein
VVRSTTDQVTAAGAAEHLGARLVRDPRTWTLLLTALMLAAGAALTALAPSRSFVPPPFHAPLPVLLVVLAIAFFLSELGMALVEFRRQSYSFSLSTIPLLLGLLYCPPQYLIAVRLGASLLAFVVQRTSPLKLAYNAAAYLLDSALVIALAHLLVAELTTGPAVDGSTAAACYVALAVVDVLMSCLVLAVIRINDGPVTGADVVDVLVPAAVFVALNTCLGMVCALLVEAGPLGVGLLGVVSLVIALSYRAYLTLRRNHRSLQVVQEFIEVARDFEGTGGADALAGRLLTAIRDLVLASRVELVLLGADGNVELRCTVDEVGARVATGPGRRSADRHPELHDDAPVLLTAGTAAPADQRWLADRGVGEACVVPLGRSGADGVLLAMDRMGGERSSFSGDDLQLLQALAGHLAVALRNDRLVQQLRHDATHDNLTGLPNRSLLMRRLQQAMEDGPGDGRLRPGVLLLDLDRFKEVNDALGHHVGDELLAVVADRLTALDLPGATIARLGGDEFAVLLPSTTEHEAAETAHVVASALRRPVDLPDATLSTEASIGVALAEEGDDHTDLLRHADTAMYSAKTQRKVSAVYSAQLDAGRAERLALLADLHGALDRDELELHYQPKLDLSFGLVTGVEALVRWTHPTLGSLAPDVFVGLAESTGLIDQLTRNVLAAALKQCRAWMDDGLNLTVAVNLSARNVLDPALPEQVAAALAAAGVPAHRLVLEITESSVMEDADRTVPTLLRLAAIGVTLSLDDFGTGYSSLSYLQRLPVQEVKIDRSFVAGLTDAAAPGASEVLVRSIVSLGASLGLRVVAEGVESAAALDRLRELGCDVVQGYHVSRPLPADRLGHLLGASLPVLRRSAGSADRVVAAGTAFADERQGAP